MEEGRVANFCKRQDVVDLLSYMTRRRDAALQNKRRQAQAQETGRRPRESVAEAAAAGAGAGAAAGAGGSLHR